MVLLLVFAANTVAKVGLCWWARHSEWQRARYSQGMLLRQLPQLLPSIRCSCLPSTNFVLCPHTMLQCSCRCVFAHFSCVRRLPVPLIRLLFFFSRPISLPPLLSLPPTHLSTLAQRPSSHTRNGAALLWTNRLGSMTVLWAGDNSSSASGDMVLLFRFQKL